MSGNFATPWRALSVLETAVAEYHLFALNAQEGIPDRDGVVLESAFVGPGMRRSERLRYFPCRLSLVPNLLAETLPPDVVLLHTSVPADGTVSLGIEVNVLPAAIEEAGPAAAWSSLRSTPACRTPRATPSCRKTTSITG